MADNPLNNFRRVRTRHGLSKKREYAVWNSMLQRCYSSNHPQYEYYGGRGIGACERWWSFVNYLSDIEAMLGPRPSPQHSIDRINNDGNYEPGNVRWATHEEQSNNRRNTDADECAAKAAEDAAFEWQMQVLKDLSQVYRKKRELLNDFDE